ncbi:hypothetical protein [Paraburkholderia kururiensis]|jgi:hypothetical protein|uniref:Uncharacterized protein n=1 Tax=Paraburkholderia kururiensis TaxID=984307 RepID=A0ABZ0WFT8_9BURK|nr:hypothetical protein [Paraburkholderia kururiensis]WQD76207.1 hypothetical protein U0042_19090 [Paraburkholderia kururiensis]
MSAAGRAAALAQLERARCCAACRLRADDRHSMEQSIAGLAVFGSGFGDAVAASRLCTLHDRLVSPRDTCSQFQPLPASASA